jgi:Spy/CpxP family protein refolding chaperone
MAIVAAAVAAVVSAAAAAAAAAVAAAAAAIALEVLGSELGQHVFEIVVRESTFSGFGFGRHCRRKRHLIEKKIKLDEHS